MSKETYSPWDRAEFLGDDEAIVEYLNVGVTGVPSCGRTGMRWRHGPTV